MVAPAAHTIVTLCLAVLLFSTAPRPVQSQVLTPRATGNERQLPPDYFGYNGANFLGEVAWDDSALIRALVPLKPALLRYPGGTESNYWNWKVGWFVTGFPMPNYLRQLKPRSVRLENFQASIRATGAVPVYVLNLLSSDLETQLGSLREAKGLGLPVKYVELGNEFYIGSADHKSKFPTAAAYAQEANRWTAAIKKEFPEAKVASVAAPPKRVRDRRWLGWNADLLSTLQGGDALTLHHYYGTGLSDPYRRSQRSRSLRYSATEIASILGTPFVAWNELRTEGIGSLPVGREIWITEYNLFDRSQPLAGTWVHGLGVTVTTLLFIDEPRITHVLCHTLLGNALFASIFSNERGFLVPTDFTRAAAPPQSVPLALTATGSALKLVGAALAGKTLGQKLDFPGAPTIRAGRGAGYPSLLGWSFGDGRNRQAIVVNLASSTQQITTAAVIPQGSFEQVSGDPLTLVSSPASLRKTSGGIAKNLALPPYSITRFSS
ncbi:hypothetical protein [Gloeobacter violaceus]|nr:hypothetical protein [Gloeobacter violaceus]